MKIIKLDKVFKCNKCGHKWVPRKKGIPERCPLCNNKHWNMKRRIDLMKLLIK